MKKFAITWTATEAIYGISRDDHCAGVVYRCDCGCSPTDGQGWLKRKIINLGPLSITLFQCSICRRWFAVCTFLFTTAWFKRKYPDDAEPPEFYSQFKRRPEDVAKKWMDAPYILSPAEHIPEKPPADRHWFTEADIPCFWCGGMLNIKTVSLRLYSGGKTAKTPTRVCNRCQVLVDNGTQWVYCETCKSWTWEHHGVVAEKWERYFNRKPRCKNISKSQIVMTDHCPVCR